jgi:hypothetical protein
MTTPASPTTVLLRRSGARRVGSPSQSRSGLAMWRALFTGCVFVGPIFRLCKRLQVSPVVIRCGDESERVFRSRARANFRHDTLLTRRVLINAGEFCRFYQAIPIKMARKLLLHKLLSGGIIPGQRIQREATKLLDRACGLIHPSTTASEPNKPTWDRLTDLSFSTRNVIRQNWESAEASQFLTHMAVSKKWPRPPRIRH